MIVKRRENGNVLFLILIAVSLFAALSYAVTQSSRSGEGGVGRDKAKLQASQITQYATQMEQTISRLLLTARCTNTQISFWYDSNSDASATSADDYYNPNAPASYRCHVFRPEGGGLSFFDVDSNLLDHAFSATAGFGKPWFINTVQVLEVGSDCNSAECTELVLFVPFIKEEVCRQLNSKLLGAEQAYNGNAGGATYHVNYRFIGTYAYYGFVDNGKIGSGTAGEEVFVGKRSGCFRNMNIASQPFFFYHVLIPR